MTTQLCCLSPFNVPETNVGQLWMADEYEKGYLNCITNLSPQFLLLVTTILSIQVYAFDPFIVYYFSISLLKKCYTLLAMLIFLFACVVYS